MSIPAASLELRKVVSFDEVFNYQTCLLIIQFLTSIIDNESKILASTAQFSVTTPTPLVLMLA